MAPELGRLFDESDDRPANQGAVAVLSHGTWQSWFGGDPEVLGKTVTLRPFYVDPVHCTIIGVVPEEFASIEWPAPQIWLPAMMEKSFKDAAQVNFRMMGRLVDGVGHRRAESALDVVAASVAAKHGGRPIPGYGNEGIFRSDLHTELRYAALGSWGAFRSHGPLRRARLLAFGVAGLVLLIACANIANLLLARAERRRKEMALRISLGASRSRVLRAALIESLMLSLLGGCAGILLSLALNRILVALKPPEVELLVRMQLDPRVAGFCSGGCGVIRSVLRSCAGMAWFARESQSGAQGPANFPVTRRPPTTGWIRRGANCLIAGSLDRSRSLPAKLCRAGDIGSGVQRGQTPGGAARFSEGSGVRRSGSLPCTCGTVDRRARRRVCELVT